MNIKKRFQDLSIKTKLYAIALGIAFILLIIGLLSYYYIRKIKSFTDLSLSVEVFTRNVIQLRRAEKDFLLRDQVDPDFFRTGESKYLKSFAKYYQRSKIIIDTLKNNPGLASEASIVRKLNDIDRNFDLYKSTFDELVETVQIRGYQEAGIAGEMQDAAHEVYVLVVQSASSDEFESKITNLRMIEKNYLLSKNPQYKDQLVSVIDYLKKQIEAETKTTVPELDYDTGIPEETYPEYNDDAMIPEDDYYYEEPATGFTQEEADKLFKALDNYKSLFIQLVDIDIKIGLTLDDGLKGKAEKIIHKVEENVTIVAETAEEKSKREISQATITLFVLIGLLIIIIVWLLIRISNSIARPLVLFKDYILQLGRGELPDKFLINTKDEIGEMGVAINKLTDNLKNTKKFAIEVGKGNLETQINIFDNRGDLGGSLVQMREELLKVAKERERQIKEEEQRNWANRGIAKFSDLLRQSSNNIEELGTEVLMHLVKYVNANQAGLFIYNDDNKEDIHLELVAAYAYNRRKFLNRKIYIGEGLVGMCAYEKKTIYMTKIPDDYVDITSGLGSANPHTLLIVPLKLETEIFGIMEIASFNEFQPFEIEFIEKIGDNIASTLSTLKINLRTAQLLEQSKIQAEELASKEEEMRQNMEELQATQETAAKKTANMTAQLQAVNKTNVLLELDLDGKISDANKMFCKLMGYKETELDGKPHEILVDRKYAETDEYKDFIKNITKGYTTVEGVYKFTTKEGGKAYFKAVYTGITDENDNPLKIIMSGYDVTDFKNSEEQLLRQVERLQKDGNKQS